MKTLLDPSFQYIPACATDIRERFIANGMVPKKPILSEIERLRLFKRQIETLASFVDGRVTFDEQVFEDILAEADGASNDH